MEQQKRGNPRKTIGVVLKASMNKTLVVGVTTWVQHKMYKKFIRRTKKYYVHDEQSKGKLGDKVQIIETKPVSKTKRWRVVEVITS